MKKNCLDEEERIVLDCKDEDVLLKLVDLSIWSIALLVVLFAEL